MEHHEQTAAKLEKEALAGEEEDIFFDPDALPAAATETTGLDPPEATRRTEKMHLLHPDHPANPASRTKEDVAAALEATNQQQLIELQRRAEEAEKRAAAAEARADAAEATAKAKAEEASTRPCSPLNDRSEAFAALQERYDELARSQAAKESDYLSRQVSWSLERDSLLVLLRGKEAEAEDLAATLAALRIRPPVAARPPPPPDVPAIPAGLLSPLRRENADKEAELDLMSEELLALREKVEENEAELEGLRHYVWLEADKAKIPSPIRPPMMSIYSNYVHIW